MKNNKKVQGYLYGVLGIGSLIYFLCIFIAKISFSEFWFLLGTVLLVVAYMKIKNKYILSKFKVGRKLIKFIIIIIIIGFIGIEIPIVYYGNKSYKGKSDYVIVLGAGLNGRFMSPTLYERVNEALAYTKLNAESKIIVSGGKGKGETISEAEAMEDFLIKNGISKNRIIKEDKSTNTYENLLFSHEKLRKVEGMGDEEIKNLKISVVTSNFHVFRAKFLGKRVGFKLQGIPAKVVPYIKLNFYVREALAVVKSLLLDR